MTGEKIIEEFYGKNKMLYSIILGYISTTFANGLF